MRLEHEPTILNEDSQALLNQKRSIEDDEAETERQDVVAGSHFEEISDALLRD